MIPVIDRRWVVQNKRTGIIVSTWEFKVEADRDKQQRDDKWAEAESPSRSELVARRLVREMVA